MSKLDQRGVIHLLVPLILLLGIIGGVYLITAGPLKLFPKASVSGPISGPIPPPSPVPSSCTIDDMRAAFGATKGDSRYNPYCDINLDGRISATDYSALVSRPTPSPLPSPSPSPSPISGYQRVFITSTIDKGNLGGLEGADAKCQARADAAGLGGKWKAWLSTYRTSASSRLTHHNGPYKLLNGATIADSWDDLTRGHGIRNLLTVNEFGQTQEESWVWTDTDENGNPAEYSDPEPFRRARDCKEWTFGGSGFTGNRGASGWIDYRWTKYLDIECSAGLPLYCFEQTTVTVQPSPNPIACTINDLRAAFFARRGDPKYNPACDVNNDGRISVTDYSALLRNLRR